MVQPHNKKSPSINFHFKRDCPIISCYTATFPLGPLLKGRSVHWYRCGAEGARGGEGKEHNTWPFQWSPLVHLDYGEERGKQSGGRKEEEGLWAWLRTIVSLCSATPSASFCLAEASWLPGLKTTSRLPLLNVQLSLCKCMFITQSECVEGSTKISSSKQNVSCI